MRIAILAAVARNGVIGRGGRLPWHLPEDLAHFRRTTLGKPVLMGRRTFESIGRALPGRRNLVVSADPRFSAPGCEVVRSIEEGVRAAEASGAEELVVIGGASLYAALLPRTDRLYLTRVHADVEGDTRFPELDLTRFVEMERSDHPADARHAHSFSIVRYERTGTVFTS